MRNVILAVFLFLLAPAGIPAQQSSETQSQIQTVDYCILRNDPDLYNGHIIRVTGIYLRGFEMSAFYGKACVDDRSVMRYETWVEKFYRAKIVSGQDTSAIVATFLSGKGGSELEVTLIGIFRGSKEGRGFGHLNGSKFQIEVSNIESAKLLPDEVAGCRRVDQTKPFHYLSYEKVEKGIPTSYDNSKRPKSENLIYLRLANNSTCPISIPTIDNPDSRALQDNSEVSLVYDLDSPCVRVGGRPITKVKKILSVLAPGNSIYFTVPLRFLTKEPYGIRIPFDSGKAKDSSYYQPFYFSRYDLPEELQKDIDCTKY